MWQGKKKAVTFSFDDGLTQDKRLVALFNRYGLKATFNICSGLFERVGTLDRNGKTVDAIHIPANEVCEAYRGHEIASHTLTHPTLTTCSDESVIRQVSRDVAALEALTGDTVVGMAYPGGGVNNDDRVADIIRKNTALQYARTTTVTHNFDLQDNLMRFQPTVKFIEDCLFEIGERFLKTESDEPQLLYIWGHSYELDAEYITWERFEEFCRMIAGHDDIFYGTNREVLLDK